ncbi:relaxase domain-containing protein (plasmid) [Actinacidiphila glaucinigra]|uniref:MobF family relaxase n=1 Tax=Actinacidiphila glaucinigra TaxID=235986 RepID=UPI002DD9EEF4|nr:MobF family relaxase [Actinacidiphila glaucinigra]WSD65992.1 relaxase domain-containing protein [Actinacidiphila glaucinigra]WSD66000.1 relaxase domain-containing protein [Actinacidiphila glaucinigra]
MTVKGITAASYPYYRHNIAAADGARGSEAAVSSSTPGVPVGEWHGAAAVRLGLAGEVTEPQMRALFGLGMHPDAEAIVAIQTRAGAGAARAMRAAKLGPALPNLAESSPLDRQIEQALDIASERVCRPLTKAEAKQVRMAVAAQAFRAEYHRTPDSGAELGRFLAARTGQQRQARTGFDLTFSSEELSLLFALGDEAVRRTALEVQQAARAETVAWIENHALAVRSGAGGVVQEQAVPGVLATVYLHYESRAGDPMLHEHVVISPRVQGPDGRWRNLDNRLLYREIVAASELFNQRVLELLCERLGLRTEPVEVTPGQRPVMRIAGIDARLRELFSQRGTAIRITAETLFDDYARRHGRQPGPAARTRLKGQATLLTRPAKRAARSLDELLDHWRRRAVAATDQATVDGLLDAAQAAAHVAAPVAVRRATTPVDVDVAAAAAAVLAEVAAHRTTFRRRHVLAEARRYLMRTLAGATAPSGAADRIADQALADADCLEVTPPDINPSHPELTRPDGTSVYQPIGARTYTTATLLAAENRLLAAARTDVIPPVGREAFARAAAVHDGPLGAAQRELAASFALSDKLLLAGLGPAGSGKTTSMRLLAAAAHAAGSRVIPLAPSARAAKVLGSDLRLPAHTLHSWLHQRELAAQGHDTDDAFALRPGDVVLVDEAGMAGTRLLDKILAEATAAGAVVRLLGDPHQLAAIESGGALRLIAGAGGAVELDRLHRFRTPGEADASLALRDSKHPAEAFTWYRDRGRVTAGPGQLMHQAVFEAWAADTLAGRTTLMTAADTATVTALNARAQAWHIAAGRLDTRSSIALRAGARAHVGDIIVTRLNARRMSVRGGRDFVKNGDTWTVQAVDPNGELVVRHTGHHGRIRLPADYVAGHCELGYASTIHRAQGMTVDTSHALATPASGREGVYVQLTRGRHTNRLYVALDHDGQDLNDVLTGIAARRRAQLSATETIADLQRHATAPGTLAAQYADVARRATTARLTGVLEHTLGLDRAAAFLAADAFPALIRALADAERTGFDLPRLLTRTLTGRALADADDIAALLTWRLRRHLTDAAHAATTTPQSRPLAHLTLDQLHNLAHLAAAHRTAAHTELQAADAAMSVLPAPVTTRDGITHPAWPDRPHGPLTRTQLAAEIATARAAYRDAARTGTPLSPAARATIAALTAETALRRTLPWKQAAREDWQRDRGRHHTGSGSLAATRRHHHDRADASKERQFHARTALARADAITGRIDAELRLRDRLPDHLPHQPNQHADIPDWAADRTCLTHPDTPGHWRQHLAERHRILARAVTARGHTLADHPPAWARPLGPPPPATSPNRRAAWATTCALVELWRTRHAITTVPGLGPRPADPGDAAAWDAMTARIRAFNGSRHPMHTPPPGAPASDVLAAVLAHLDSPPPGGAYALPAHPAVRDPHGIAPLNNAAADARLARSALAAALAGEAAPEAWIGAITAPDEDNEDEQHAYTRLVTALADYRRRHHRAGSDILGPRPSGIDGQEWDHLTDAIDLYTRARIEARLEQLRQRTEAARADLPAAPRVPPPAPRRGNRNGHRTGRPRPRRR